jgi:tRNA pseudouridine38-40 synthase
MQYRLIVEYDGTEFSGWQLQPHGRTVQGVLEQAVERFIGSPVRVSAAGRTDAGVHAAGQVVTFRCDRVLDPTVVRRALGALTPDDLAVRSVEIVAGDFDVRRAARARVYVYRIWNRRQRSPFWRRYAWHVPWPLDAAAMHAAAAQLVGEHDFSSFRAAECDAAHPMRRVVRSGVARDGDLLVYEVEATAFLRHMVRNIVGTLVEIGSHRRDADLAALLALRDRTRAAATAPAHGLCLSEVRY